MADDLEALLGLYTSTPTTANVTPSPKAKDDGESILNAYLKGAQAIPKPVAKNGKGLSNNDADSGVVSTLKNVATGAIKGAADVPGFVGNTSGLADYIYNRAASAITGRSMEDIQARNTAIDQRIREQQTPIGQFADTIAPRNVMPSGDTLSAPVLGVTGQYEPQGPYENMLQSGVRAGVGAFAPGVKGARLTPASVPVAAGIGGISQGVADATGEPLMGIASAMAVPAFARVLGGATNKLMGTVSPERADLASLARDKYGIPVNAGQVSESPFARFLEDTTRKLPFSGAGKTTADQHTAFNRSVAQTFGEDAPKVTPEVMARARDRIGQDFETVAAGTKIVPDPTLIQDLNQVYAGAATGPAGLQKRVQANLTEIADRIRRNGGEVPYQDLTRVGNPANGKGAGLVQKLINDPDPNVKEVGHAIRDALDASLTRHAPADMQSLLSQARGQWRNMRTVEDLVAKSPDGDLSPALLQNKVNVTNKGTYGRAYGGGGDLGELADIGQAFLKPPPSSGTPERTFIHGLLMNMPSAFYAGATGDVKALAYTPAAMGAGILAGRGVNRLLNNDNVTQSLINRSRGLPGPVSVPNKLLNSALPSALLAVRP